MARINRSAHPKTELYCQLAEASSRMGETNDCVVKALAMASGASYEVAHEVCARSGRRHRMGMFQSEWLFAAKAMGLTLERVDPAEFINQYPGQHKGLKSVTTHHPDRFKSVWRDGNDYLVQSSRHLTYVQDGTAHDWARGRALRAIAIFRIVRD